MLSSKREKYAERLQETARAMQNLANELVEYGRPLEKPEKQLLRMACLPMVKSMLEDITVTFVVGSNANENPNMQELCDMFGDLHD